MRQPVTVPVDVPRDLQNDNNGSGAFYQANGTQIICHYHYPAQWPLGESPAEESSLEGAHDEECTSMGVDHGPELEPYQTIIDSLSRICQQVQSFSDYIPSDKAIAHVSCKADELAPFVRCVARVIREIGKASRGFLSHTIFFAIEQRAFDCTLSLREFRRTLDEIDPRQDSSRQAGMLAGPRCHDVSTSTSASANSRILELFGVKNGGLGELITSLPRKWDIHHPSVDTIWVREPAGINWYTIPLRFCETWKDFVTVIHQYCRNGPEMEYIRGGNWAIIRDVDNDIVEQSRFTSIIKPEMRFDIGIIVQLLSAMTHICPQCGHYNDDCEPTANGWIRW
ncbi:hypothetical protein CCMSSC00406_0007975 [Pleurotus cornucopiae]|uniref:Uncharacterized protein n=1 Tax=Pleurotus cornucopiae TaxID=5321 RepID=A0ACB7IL47_PLECO|nr:hypothetical protein CCMSSC00406_0007975 [Pleurotus cornucopiae]